MNNLSIYDKTSNKAFTYFVMCFYLFILGSFGIRSRFIFVLMVIVALLFPMLKNKKVLTINKLRINWYFLVGVIVLLVVMPNARQEADVINDIIYIMIITLVLSFVKTNNEEIKKILHYSIIISIIAAVYISFFRIFSNLYFSMILPLLSPSVAETVRLNAKFGYGVALGNSYTFGDYVIMMGAASLIGKDVSSGGKNIKYKILIMILVVGMLLEGRKGELISGLASILLIYLFCADYKRIKNLPSKLISILLVGCVIVISIPVLARNGYLMRFQRLIDGITSSNTGITYDFSSGRFDLWENAINLFLENPIIGAGWGRFANYTTGVFRETYDGQSVRDVHNVFLQLLCETGIVGAVLICIPIFNIFKITINDFSYFKSRNFVDSFDSECTIFTLTILIFFGVLSFLDPVFYNHYFWCVYAIAVMIQENSHYSRLKKNKLSNTLDNISAES